MEIESLPSPLTYKSICEKNCDNLISVLKKKREHSLKLAVCICMYSEERKMLDKTLSGVEKNIRNMVKNEGINMDEIGVFVIMDGIEPAHESMKEFFQNQ